MSCVGMRSASAAAFEDHSIQGEEKKRIETCCPNAVDCTIYACIDLAQSTESWGWFKTKHERGVSVQSAVKQTKGEMLLIFKRAKEHHAKIM